MTHDLSFHAAGWHADLHTPVVDNKYYDPATGELVTTVERDHHEYQGPPAVDLVITSFYEGADTCHHRAMRAFPMVALLAHILRVVDRRKLGIDTVTATPYAIRVIIADHITSDTFYKIADEMVNGIWDVKVEGEEKEKEEKVEETKEKEEAREKEKGKGEEPEKETKEE